MMTTLAFMLFASMAQQQSACEGLKTLRLPQTTITTAEFRPAGAAPAARGRGAGPALPAHCRVAAVLAPSSDSHIEMELWMPVENWNGKFLAVGNGGWAGTSVFSRACGVRDSRDTLTGGCALRAYPRLPSPHASGVSLHEK
jgi:feruloyl esterase